MAPRRDPKVVPIEAATKDPTASAILRHSRAMEGVGEGLQAVAAAIAANTAQRAPVDHFVAGLGDRLDALCSFLRRRGPWLLASVPGVLMAIGAVTPNAADALAAFLKGFVQ